MRKLEFLLADAKRKGAEIVFTTGGAQSNHAMLTAACAKKLGMTPILILKKRGVTERKGNQLLEYLMDTDVRFVDTDDYNDIYAEMDRVGKELGRPYYKIPAAVERARRAGLCQLRAGDRRKRHALRLSLLRGGQRRHARGRCAGRAAVYAADAGHRHDGRYRPLRRDHPRRIMREAAELLELDFTPTSDSVHLVDMCGPGYAIPSKEGNAAIRMMAENEGLFLDPVYTGKAFAGVIKLAREGKFRPTDNVLFLYSGGAGGLFAIDVDLD